MTSKKASKIAFFDLDYTIIPHDTLFLFASFVLGKKPWRIYYLFFLIPAFVLYLLKLLSAQKLKRAFLTIIAGLSKETIHELCDEFTTKLLNHTYPEIRLEIDKHKKNKTKLVLNTASPVFYIEPLGKKLGFDICIGSEFIIEKKMPLFAKPSGENNKRFIKLDNMEKMIGARIISDIKNNTKNEFLKNTDSYSDSSSDLPLLLIAERKHVINPDKNLLQIAKKRSWKIWRPKQPYQSSFGKFVTNFVQMIGFFKI